MSETLDAILASVDEAQRASLRERLTAWAGDQATRLTLEARYDEIVRFVDAGHAQQRETVASIQSYFMGRAVMLCLAMEAPVAD